MNKHAGISHRSNDGREVRQLRRELAGVRCEKRADAGSFIRGLAAVFYVEGDPGTEYWLWSDMVERIMPGAFDRAISEAHDARGLFNHDHSQLLGRVASGTCRLAVTAKGLSYEIDADPADPDHQRVLAKIDRGDVTGSSFAFVPRDTRWQEIKNADGTYLGIREIHDVDLYDVGPVTWPAYESTAAGRSSTAISNCLHDRWRAVRRNDSEERVALIAERDSHLRPHDDEAIQLRLRSLAV